MRRVLAEAAVIWLASIVWTGLTRWWRHRYYAQRAVEHVHARTEAMHEALREPTT